MSINVTVSGNPVRIKRGKMVTCRDPTKNEFQKRRLMRLEQVRHQSRDIAENIRNKLRKEQSKQLSDVERDGEIKLKNWQARKLLELQNQYQETLDEIGLGHKLATEENKNEELYMEQQQVNDQIAQERGREAAERLQIEKNQKNLQKAVGIQRKKLSRDVENIRSKNVTDKSKCYKSPHKKKKTREQFDSDSENKVPQLYELEESDSGSVISTPELDEPPERFKLKSTEIQKSSKEQQTSNISFHVPTRDKAAQTIAQEEILTGRNIEIPIDSRISERIKRRMLLNPDRDYCDFVEKELPPRYSPKLVRCVCCQCPVREDREGKFQEHKHSEGQEYQEEKIQDQRQQEEKERQQDQRKQETKIQEPSKDSVDLERTSKQSVTDKTGKRIESDSRSLDHEMNLPDTSDKSLKGDKNLNKSRSKDFANKKDSIPTKPKITLKPSKERPSQMSGSSEKVKFYDHPNRFSKEYIPKSSHVERIDDDNLVISPNMLSEDELREKMRQRDIDAHIRGQIALEKERIQREYRELLKKLPILQKQERIYEIGTDKEKYHMSKDRLEELERKRQNRLDNAYEELFVRRKPNRVTLPTKPDERDVPPSLNLASWDVDFDPSEGRNNGDTSSMSRTEQLNQLLMNLKAQKNHLLKEIENTLSKDTFNQASSDFPKSSVDDLKSKSTDYPEAKPKRKRSRDARGSSPTNSEVLEEESSDNKANLPKRKNKKNLPSTTTTSSPSPRKKLKLRTRRKVLVLQNTSTQTTPKTQSAATSPFPTPVTDETKKSDVACTCNKEIKDDMCEIVIKIREDEKPEVIVNPPEIGKSVTVITESKDSDGRTPVEEKDGDSKKNKKQDSDRRTPVEDKGGDSIKIKKQSPRNKRTKEGPSWREHLTQSTSSNSTSSTSYMDPPNSAKSLAKDDRSKITKKASKPPPSEFSKSINSTVSSTDGKKLDPRLLVYIKKLLSMSRASIDDLAVSAASDVSTPTPSIVDTPTNNPLNQLLNVMKYFNLNATDLKKQLADESDLHYNTKEISSSSSEGEKSALYKSCTNITVSEKIDKHLDETKTTDYADIAATCTKKISSLTALINKVREEKKQILKSPPTSSDSDKDLTSYLTLPERKEDEKDTSSSSSKSEHNKTDSSSSSIKEEKSTSSSSLGQDELDKKLLEIDYSYAEKLKRLTSEQIENEKRRVETDEELLQRLKKLLSNPVENKIIHSVSEYGVTLPQFDEVNEGERPLRTISNITSINLPQPDQNQKDRQPFPSVSSSTSSTLTPPEESPSPPPLLDIPKLPRLEASSLEKKKKRPPLSKGLRTLGGDVPMLPHELSTIIEADSQISTKADSPTKAAKSSSSKSSSVPDILTEIKEVKSQSSSDVSEQETMETMLISIGMEWAIPTLKKTREALALASSSSNSGSKKESEVSLKEFLSKISSSSSKSDSSDLQRKIHLDNRRTSTPILENDDLKKSGPIFLTDSDISSVKENSDKDKFYDLAEESASKLNSTKKSSDQDNSKSNFFDLNQGSGSLSKTG